MLRASSIPFPFSQTDIVIGRTGKISVAQISVKGH